MSDKSDKELERIVSCLTKYIRDTKLSRNDAIMYIVEKLGYKKCNFIPTMYDTFELEEISKMCLKFMRNYSLTLESFVNALIQKHEYHSIVGFQTDINQFKIIEEEYKGDMDYE